MIVIFFFNDTATTEIYTLSLHDALPIYRLLAEHGFRLNAIQPPADLLGVDAVCDDRRLAGPQRQPSRDFREDRKSTRLNSSHANISYAVFCLKKKNNHMFFYFQHLSPPT